MAKFNIFGGYSKPGRGVSKSEAYEKSPFAKYFEILGRKFWDICILSLIFLLTMVPFIGLSYLIYTLIRNTAIAGDLQLSAVIILSPFMLSGPFSAEPPALQGTLREKSRYSSGTTFF